ncbi:MAG: response regulator [Lachnospiraceae bacterium]|nr:response regulator [Lachnospiraceae bacterium]
MYIGEMIRQYRERKEITQKDLAEKLNVTPQAVSRWENGISMPDIYVLPKLANLLHISIDGLLGYQGDNETKICEEELCKFLVEGQPKEPVLSQNQIDAITGYLPGAERVSGQRILAIDDSAFMRMMLENILTSNGHIVWQAEDGQEALDILKNKSVDLCLLDIAMPNKNGFDTLKEIKKIYPNLKVVMLSARCQECYVTTALNLGANGFVAKPFQPEGLIERLNHCLQMGDG